MQKLINQESVLENNWTIISNAENGFQGESLMIEFNTWLENKDQVSEQQVATIYLNGDADLEAVAPYLDQFALIGINFPAFADGRGYSVARLLKERYDFKGELRAIGDVLIDQLFFMKRCGFDSFLLKEGLSAEKALGYFKTFTDPYQLAYDIKTPLFRRKQ